MPREQQRLQVRHEPEWRNFVEKGMFALRPLAFLPSGKHRLSAFVGQENGPIVLGHEILHAQLSAIEQRQGEPIGQSRAQFLHEIERETRTARPVPVKKADCGIEADALRRAPAIMREKCVEEG